METNAPTQDEPPDAQVIATTPLTEPPLNVGNEALKRAKLTPTDRIEARADLHIGELKADKESLRLELRAVRDTEMSHLREDVRWLEAREASLQKALTALHTSYDWAISFNWFSFALVTVGGGLLGYASFLPTSQFPFATLGLAALSIGVIVQAFVSYRGVKTLTGLAEDAQAPPRPSPNPRPPEGRPSRG